MNLIGTLSLEGDEEWLEYSVLEGSCRKEAVSAFLDALAREARRRKKEVVMWCEPIIPDSAHSQLPAFRTCMASNSTGGRYPRLECKRF
jgi:hypothetical protein